MSEQLIDRKIAPVKTRAEIAARQALEVDRELLRKWQIEPVDVAQVPCDLGIDRTLGIERTARRKPHQNERQRDDDEQ